MLLFLVCVAGCEYVFCRGKSGSYPIRNSKSKHINSKFEERKMGISLAASSSILPDSFSPHLQHNLSPSFSSCVHSCILIFHQFLYAKYRHHLPYSFWQLSFLYMQILLFLEFLESNFSISIIVLQTLIPVLNWTKWYQYEFKYTERDNFFSTGIYYFQTKIHLLCTSCMWL